MKYSIVSLITDRLDFEETLGALALEEVHLLELGLTLGIGHRLVNV